jgi:hypothetical protein
VADPPNAAAISVLVYAGMDREENKQKVALTELPIAVQKTIQDNLAEELSPRPRRKPKEAGLSGTSAPSIANGKAPVTNVVSKNLLFISLSMEENFGQRCTRPELQSR